MSLNGFCVTLYFHILTFLTSHFSAFYLCSPIIPAHFSPWFLSVPLPQLLYDLCIFHIFYLCSFYLLPHITMLAQGTQHVWEDNRWLLHHASHHETSTTLLASRTEGYPSSITSKSLFVQHLKWRIAATGVKTSHCLSGVD